MTLWFFEGPAGSGKTTRLFDAVKEYVAVHPFQPYQKVLALTKMHGARQRMNKKLAELPGIGVTSDCTTLNSFTLGLIHRWSSLVRVQVDPLPSDIEFSAIAEAAASLLSHDMVVKWVAAKHPVLVVDELQDLRGPELAVVKALARVPHQSH